MVGGGWYLRKTKLDEVDGGWWRLVVAGGGWYHRKSMLHEVGGGWWWLVVVGTFEKQRY